MKPMRLFQVRVVAGKKQKKQAVRTAKVADSVADDLTLQARVVKQDIKNEKSTRSFEYWKVYNPIAEAKEVADKKAAEKEAIRQEILAEQTVKKETKPSSNGSTELEAVRAEYLEVVGKKPHHMAGIEKLKTEIENAKK